MAARGRRASHQAGGRRWAAPGPVTATDRLPPTPAPRLHTGRSAPPGWDAHQASGGCPLCLAAIVAVCADVRRPGDRPYSW